MLWQTCNRTFDLTRRGLIMGVVNVTADSFSDGGRFFDCEAAVAHAEMLAIEGADILDIGGESTRPGAEPVAAEEEMRRVLPVIERLAGKVSCAISIDTMKPEVAQAAMECGAEIINDVTGMRSHAMRETAQRTGAGVIAMHMKGMPRDMQNAPRYANVCAEIQNFFRQTFAACVRFGIDPMRLAIDPGIGFGKTVAHNLTLLRNLESMRVHGRPLVLGVSRKSFIGKLLGSDAIADREWPTVALTSYGRAQGANVFRVHAVRSNAQALRMTESILELETPA